MGLLDSLLSGSQGGGLLDFLRNNAMNQQFSSGMSSDQAQYGAALPSNPPAQMQPGRPMQPAMQSIPQQPPPVIQAQPMQAPAQQPQPQQQMPDLGGGGLSGLARPGSLMGALLGAPNPANQTVKALLAKGVDPTTAQAAIGNPDLLKALVTQYFGQSPHRQEIDKDGNAWDVNLQTGQKTIALAAKDDKFQHVQTGESGLGQKSFGAFNTKTGETKPDAGAAQDGLGDISKSGPEYLATIPKQQQGVIQGMIDGTIQPPSSFALAKPYWQTMLAAAKSVDPTFDANNWATRHKLSTDMASSGNSSMGGILSNGKSAFAHLSDLSGSMADLGNASHDYPGGGTVAAVQNYLGNKALAGSDTRAKIKAISDNLGHYGQESTKFYSGTGGGVEERMNALKEMNPETTSSEEMASYLAKEKSLMTDRLKQKEAQIRDTMGDGYLAKHPVFTPDLQQTLDTIDANIAKLNGSKPIAQAPNRSAIETEMRRRGLLK